MPPTRPVIASVLSQRAILILILIGVGIIALVSLADTGVDSATLHEVKELESRVKHLSDTSVPDAIEQGKPASPSKAPALNSPAGARANIRTMIDAYNSAKSAGTVREPTADELRDMLKNAGSPLLPEYQGSDSDPVTGEIGHLVSEYAIQRAQSLGLMPSGNNVARSNSVQPDYDHDCDGDGAPDISIVHMDETMVVPPLPPQALDITNGMRFTWTLNSAPDSYTLTREPDGPLNSFVGHAALPLGDDNNVQVFLSHSFPFNGSSWTDLYVNSDGSVTFGRAESSSATRGPTRLFQSPALISPLFQDLDNTCSPPGGGIFFQSTASSSTFTWNQVPHYGSPHPCGAATGFDNTFQIVLYPTGNIEWRYGALDGSQIATTSTGSQAFTAITRGVGANSPVTYLDFASVTSQQLTLGTAAQVWTSDAFAFQSIVLNLGIAQFYKTHRDIYDQVLSMYVGFGVNLDTMVDGSFANFNRRNFQRTTGLGERAVYSTSSAIPGAPTLESIITRRAIEQISRLTEEEMVNPTVRPIVNTIWRDNTKISFTTGDVYGSVKNVNFTGFPWQINLTGYSPISSPAEPFFIDLVGKGASSGYTHEITASPSGVRGSVVPSPSSVFATTIHELSHRWNSFMGIQHSDSSAWGDHFFDLLSRGDSGVGGAHPGTLTDTRIEYAPNENPWGDRDAKFLPKRPRGDLMSYSAGHITQLVPKPGDPAKFVDARDPTAVYPDTPSYDMNVADELCRAQGLDLFVSTPQALPGGLSDRSLAFSGITSLEDPAVYNKQLFYIDTPRSPFGALGFNFDLRQVSGLTGLAVQNLLFCGKRYEYNIANTTQINAVRASASAQAFLGPLTTPSGSQATLSQLYYGRRGPLIGDEADSIDMAVATQYPSLYAQWNLGSCPLVSSATCNGSAFGRYGNTCVDVKTVAPIMLARPGYEPNQPDIAAFCRLINVLRTKTASHMLRGHGARGMEGDMCYLPKWSFGIPQVIH